MPFIVLYSAIYTAYRKVTIWMGDRYLHNSDHAVSSSSSSAAAAAAVLVESF